MFLGVCFLTDSQADSDGHLELDGDLIDDFLSGFRKFLSRDSLIREETREEKVEKVLAERCDSILGGKIRAVDMVDSSALPIGIENRLEQVRP